MKDIQVVLLLQPSNRPQNLGYHTCQGQDKTARRCIWPRYCSMPAYKLPGLLQISLLAGLGSYTPTLGTGMLLRYTKRLELGQEEV